MMKHLLSARLWVTLLGLSAGAVPTAPACLPGWTTWTVQPVLLMFQIARSQWWTTSYLMGKTTPLVMVDMQCAMKRETVRDEKFTCGTCSSIDKNMSLPPPLFKSYLEKDKNQFVLCAFFLKISLVPLRRQLLLSKIFIVLRVLRFTSGYSNLHGITAVFWLDSNSNCS